MSTGFSPSGTAPRIWSVLCKPQCPELLMAAAIYPTGVLATRLNQALATSKGAGVKEHDGVKPRQASAGLGEAI